MDIEQEQIWNQNLNIMLDRLENEVKNPAGGLALHLGCGPQILPGFLNIDKYFEHSKVINWDMYKLPLEDGTVSTIYSSHSLEHLPFHRAKLALAEWARVLKPGGKLFLAVPDLEVICQKMIDPDIPLATRHSWFIYTLFGYQIDPNKHSQPHTFNLSEVEDLPLDEGQFHRCGFTTETLRMFLSQLNFEITEMFQYNGWDTPSIWCSASKT
jgi:predicted SAM-dependent methyltransferase